MSDDSWKRFSWLPGGVARPAPGHVFLGDLSPGDRFLVPWRDGTEGEVLEVGAASVKVRLRGPQGERRIEIETRSGPVAFQVRRIEEWALGTEVIPLGHPEPAPAPEPPPEADLGPLFAQGGAS